MSPIEFTNVFRGPNAVAQFFNPDNSPPVPLVEIPAKLNPLYHDGVRIYAKLLTQLPGQNVKCLPALNMLLHDASAANKRIVEASSGSTVLSLAMCSRILYGNDDVTAYVTNKKHPDSLKLLRFFGLNVSLYGGLAQQEPVDPRGIMCRLRHLTKQDKSVCYPGQYDNSHNWKAHVRWTGAQIWRQLPEINVLCTTVGTGGCITGTGLYLKSQKPSVKVIGAVNVFGDATPGPRHLSGFESSPFPWREAIDDFEEVASVESYTTSMDLSREGLICGPSSGEALVGLLQYLQRVKDTGRLSELADAETGLITCAFICCDLPYQYVDGYFQKLEPQHFPPIHNDVLLTCDQDRYDERWELNANNAFHMFVPNPSGRVDELFCDRASCDSHSVCVAQQACLTNIIDLRTTEDFRAWHLKGSISSPLQGLTPKLRDVLGIPTAIHACWTNLRKKFMEEISLGRFSSMPMLVVCYDGEVGRLAASILRARGCEAYSVYGGSVALHGLIGSLGQSSPAFCEA